MKKRNPFKDLTKIELVLWILSIALVTLAFMFSESRDYLSLVASLIGVTALIFVAKGYVIGQILIVVFAVFYGIISYTFRYYGEMITYLCMSAPIALMSVISWIKHPFKDGREVKISRLTVNKISVMLCISGIVTLIFYFILKALGNANLAFSTLSVTTSFLASYLTFLRSPYYALAYAANDMVLVVLWVLASITDASYIPMVVCFFTFLLNDLYGFYNWICMERRQEREEKTL